MIKELMGELVEGVRDYFCKIPDPRKGRNTKYDFVDICMAGYSLFHLQSPSFLAHQDRLNKKFGQHNGASLFGFEEIPSDNHIRQSLDQIEPNALNGLFESLHAKLDKSSFLAQEGLVVALDGVTFFSSGKVSCPKCLTRTKEGKTKCYHAMLVPALIHPDQKYALPMAPEFITNDDGQEKQDCELNSAKRWCQSQQEWLRQNKVTLLGDDLFSRGPFIQQLLAYQDVRFVFVAKDTSHKYMIQWINAYHPNDVMRQKVSEKKGHQTHVFEYEIYQDVPLNADEKTPRVTYIKMQVTHGKTGKKLYMNTFVTNHSVTPNNVHAIACLGRNRWRIENEAFNILKTKGYNLEHNFGHGKKNLSNLLASFNLIAFLVHTLCDIMSLTWQQIRSCYTARKRFFEAISFVLSIQCFSSWDTLIHYLSDISSPPVKSK